MIIYLCIYITVKGFFSKKLYSFIYESIPLNFAQSVYRIKIETYFLCNFSI